MKCKDAEQVKHQASMYEKVILNQIGVYINTKRKEKDISIRDLNAMTGVSIGVISDLENKRCMPRIETFIRLSEALEIPISLIFENMKPIRTKKANGSMIIADYTSKYDQLSTYVAGLGYSKEEVADIVSYAKFIDFKNPKKQ